MRIFHPYWLWECYQNGMWRIESKEYDSKNLDDIIKFTGNHLEYGEAMTLVIRDWRYSPENFLTNTSINRRAYVGHAACCIKFGWPEYLVRQAWNQLTDSQQFLANKEADKRIISFLGAKNNSTQFNLW
jgi:hypothetical protein